MTAMEVDYGRSYFSSSRINIAERFPDALVTDRYEADASGLNMEESKKLITWCQQRPFGQNKVLVIHQAERLSDLVSQAFLKLLEEPPSYLVVILDGQSRQTLLPTVSSRLHELKAELTNKPNRPVSYTNLPDLDDLKLKLLAIKDRQELVGFLGELVTALSAKVLEFPSVETSDQLVLLDRTIKRLKANINQKLAVDGLLLNWRQNSGR